MRPNYQNYGSWYIHTLIVKAVQVDFKNPTEAFNFCKGKLLRKGKQFFFTNKDGVVEIKNGDYIVQAPNGTRFWMAKKKFKRKFKHAEMSKFQTNELRQQTINRG